MANKIHKQRNSLLFHKKLLAVMCSLTVSGFAMADDIKKDDAVDEVVITGRQQALANAAERKKNAESSIDSIVADDAGQLPDASMTEVLQRVSGVTIVRYSSLGNPDAFSAEGSGVQVRGLSGVAGRLNGREVFSANSGRGLSWSDVTPELMAAVDVYKSATADLIEGGTGGTIDLRTKMPFDYHDGFRADLTASASYGDLSKETTPAGSFLITDRWETDIGEIGALLDLSASKYKQRADFIRMEPFYRTKVGTDDKFIPGGYDYGTTGYDRDRKGAYLGLQWAPTESLTLSQTVFYSNYDDQSSSSGLFVVARDSKDGNGFSVDPAVSTFDSHGALLSTSNIFLRDRTTFLPVANQQLSSGGNTGVSAGSSKTRDITTSFKWDATDNLTIKGAFQAVDSSATRDNYDVFPGVPFPGSFSLDITGNLPQISLPASSATAFADPSKYEWQATMDHMERNKGDLRAANIDANYTISEDQFFRSAQAGVRYAERTESDDNSGYNWTALGRGWNGTPQLHFSDAKDGDVESRGFNDFFRGDAKLPGNTLMPSLTMVAKRDLKRDHETYGGLPAKTIQFNPDGLDHLKQETINTAAYGLVRFASDTSVFGVPYSGNVGVRVVQIENTSTGFYKQVGTSFMREGTVYTVASLGEARTGGSTFTRGLPSINFNLTPSEETKVRLGYDVTLDQPSFSALRATGQLGVDAPIPTGAPVGTVPTLNKFTTSTGNPELMPVISHNMDLSFEWYPSQSTSGHVSLFHKSIDNWITYGNASVPVPVTYTKPTAQTVMEIASKDDVFNSTSSATVKGIELGGRTFFSSLPSPWNGLGIEANYTYVNSANPGDRYIDIDGAIHTDAPLVGLSKSNINFTLMYEKGPISLRAAYSWRDKYLMSTNSNGTNGDYWYYSAPNTGKFVDISLPVYSDAYGQLDLGGTYKFNDNASVSLQVSNATDAIPQTLQGGYPSGLLPRSWYMTDRRVEMIVKYRF
jgi:iron complex outermembrane receptor protein